MNTTTDRQQHVNTTQAAARPERQGWRLARWKWQSVAAVLLALVIVDGQSVASTYAASGLAARAADAARRVATPVIRPAASPSASASPVTADVASLLKADALPDFRVSFTRIDEGEAGMPLSYTLQVRNEGQGSGMAAVSTLVPTALSNVRVSAPGFACTRRFAASGADAGTLVTCMRNDLDPGEAAELTIGANASPVAAEYRLTATADPRDEIVEADESNNGAGATLRVRS